MSGMANRIGLASSTSKGTRWWIGRGLAALLCFSSAFAACGKDSAHSPGNPDDGETGDGSETSDAGVDSTVSPVPAQGEGDPLITGISPVDRLAANASCTPGQATQC